MAAWVEAGRQTLIAACDQVMDAISRTRVEPGDSLGAARQVRAIQLMAKTMPLVALLCLPDDAVNPVALKRALKTSGLRLGSTEAEDDMTDHERDDSPENLERLRTELGSRLDRLHGLIEQKRLADDAKRGPAACGGPKPI